MKVERAVTQSDVLCNKRGFCLPSMNVRWISCLGFRLKTRR